MSATRHATHVDGCSRCDHLHRTAVSCATHHELGWLYEDGSMTCIWALVVETSSDDCRAVRLPDSWIAASRVVLP